MPFPLGLLGTSAAAGSEPYVPLAVRGNDPGGNNSSRLLSINAGLSTQPDSTQFIFSGRFRNLEATQSGMQMFGWGTSGTTQTSRMRLNTSNPGVLSLQLGSTASSDILSATFLEDLDTLNWFNVLIARNGATLQVYFNDVLLSPSALPTAASQPFATADSWAIGSNNQSQSGSASEFADVWFQPNTYLDMSVEANRRHFVTADGDAVDLGENGEKPLGFSPDIFFGGANTVLDWNQGNNRGAILDTNFVRSGPEFVELPTGWAAAESRDFGPALATWTPYPDAIVSAIAFRDPEEDWGLVVYWSFAENTTYARWYNKNTGALGAEFDLGKAVGAFGVGDLMLDYLGNDLFSVMVFYGFIGGSSQNVFLIKTDFATQTVTAVGASTTVTNNNAGAFTWTQGGMVHPLNNDQILVASRGTGSNSRTAITYSFDGAFALTQVDSVALPLAGSNFNNNDGTCVFGSNGAGSYLCMSSSQNGANTGMKLCVTSFSVDPDTALITDVSPGAQIVGAGTDGAQRSSSCFHISGNTFVVAGGSGVVGMVWAQYEIDPAGAAAPIDTGFNRLQITNAATPQVSYNAAEGAFNGYDSLGRSTSIYYDAVVGRFLIENLRVTIPDDTPDGATGVAQRVIYFLLPVTAKVSSQVASAPGGNLYPYLVNEPEFTVPAPPPPLASPNYVTNITETWMERAGGVVAGLQDEFTLSFWSDFRMHTFDGTQSLPWSIEGNFYLAVSQFFGTISHQCRAGGAQQITSPAVNSIAFRHHFVTYKSLASGGVGLEWKMDNQTVFFGTAAGSGQWNGALPFFINTLFSDPSVNWALNDNLGEFWFDNVWMDANDPEVFQKFNYFDNPVVLGPNGEIPTGSPPLVYFGADQNSSDWNAGDNLGTAGPFTVTGEFVDLFQNRVETNGGYLVTGDAVLQSGPSDQFLLSMWMQTRTQQSNRHLLSIGNGTSAGTMRITIFNQALNNLRVLLGEGSNSDIVIADSSSSVGTNAFGHLLIARLGTTLQVYWNDSVVNMNNSPNATAQSFETWANAYIASAGGGGTPGVEFWGDFWFYAGQYLDISVEANRRLFISQAGTPVPLGANGELPLGTAPDIFFGDDQFAADWNGGVNLGAADGVFEMTLGPFTDT